MEEDTISTNRSWRKATNSGLPVVVAGQREASMRWRTSATPTHDSLTSFLYNSIALVASASELLGCTVAITRSAVLAAFSTQVCMLLLSFGDIGLYHSMARNCGVEVFGDIFPLPALPLPINVCTSLLKSLSLLFSHIPQAWIEHGRFCLTQHDSRNAREISAQPVVCACLRYAPILWAIERFVAFLTY